MLVDKFINALECDFYTGVPDSQLKPICNYLMDHYGIDPKHHVIAANEGNCTALAAGYYLATGKIPAIYLQNSGEGNIINPVASLLNPKVYAIPAIFIIGWRGEPGVHDEPQHVFQGEITLKLLEDLGISTCVINKDTTEEEVLSVMESFREKLRLGLAVAFVVRKGALKDQSPVTYKNDFAISREDAIKHIVKFSDEDPIISTTGKASRELFEIRVENGQSHKYDFLTVGSMGHSSSIALGIAINKPNQRIWCIDGDGALLMHMGALSVIGNINPQNLIHVVINNGAHETVGGMPTVAQKLDLSIIAKDCGYSYVASVDTLDKLDQELNYVKSKNELSFIEIKCSLGARDNLGRPTTTPLENEAHFMDYLRNL